VVLCSISASCENPGAHAVLVPVRYCSVLFELACSVRSTWSDENVGSLSNVSNSKSIALLFRNVRKERLHQNRSASDHSTVRMSCQISFRYDSPQMLEHRRFKPTGPCRWQSVKSDRCSARVSACHIWLTKYWHRSFCIREYLLVSL
jgi:hypothetical protein